jgi:hypothetical protein
VCVRIADGEYAYRGHVIYRHDGTPNGYWGRWSVGRGRSVFVTSTRAKCIDWIDAKTDPTEADFLAALGPCGK